MKLRSQLTGVAGEYFVAAELSRRGFIASITMRNTRGIDILAIPSVTALWSYQKRPPQRERRHVPSINIRPTSLKNGA